MTPIERALRDAQRAINSMKDTAETAAQICDDQSVLEELEEISNRGLAADMAIRAALATAQETAASRATECEQKQPNTDSLHLVEGGNTAACGDKAGALRGWQPIETAPKDGTPFLAFNPVTGWYKTRYQKGEWPMADWMGDSTTGLRGMWYPRPTHWQPLPPRPLAAAPAAEGMPNA